MFNNIRLCSFGFAIFSKGIHPPNSLDVSGTLAGHPILEFCLLEPECASCALFSTFPLLTSPLQTYTLFFIYVNPFQTSCSGSQSQSAGQAGVYCHKITWRVYKERYFLAQLEILIYWVCGKAQESECLQGSQVTLIISQVGEPLIWLRICTVPLR